jgi:hypothetical protein
MTGQTTSNLATHMAASCSEIERKNRDRTHKPAGREKSTSPTSNSYKKDEHASVKFGRKIKYKIV